MITQLVGVWVGVLTLAWASAAHGFSTGIATTSFPVPAMACNFCHGGGSAPAVTLECVDCGGGPPAVEPLTAHEFKLTVFEIGAQDHAGLNVSSPLGALSIGGAFAAGTQTITGAGSLDEITHTGPKAAAGGMIEFSFIWTAPAAPGSATLHAWGNAVNFNSNTSGDAASNVTLEVAVSGDTPTPTSTATSTETPLPSATPTPTATVGDPCPPATDPGCVTGFAGGLLLVKTDISGKERLVAKLKQGPALTQTDMGNPLDASQGGSGTSYALCIYNDADALAGDVFVARAGDLCAGQPCWKPIGHAPNDPGGPGKGYRYKDLALSADGVRKILYKGGSAGASKALVIGKGGDVPSTIAPALQSSSAATIQLRSSDGACLSLGLNEIVKSEPGFFKAK